jgi:2-dehydropantoate 2-reductase
MKIAIVGTGGVGGYFGGKMAKAGFDVTFVARGEHLKALQTNGLTVKSILGDFKIEHINATDNVHDLKSIDLIITGVKAWQVKEVACELKPVMNKNTIVMPLQNGVSAIDELKEQLNGSNIIGGLCRIFSKLESPGIINHFGVDPSIEFGELDNTGSERIRLLKGLFDQSGINASISNDITAGLWKKFITNCVSGLLALTRSTYGELREIKETRQLMVDLFTEIFVLSQKIGINLEPDFVAKTVSLIDTYPYNSTSSLTRDIWEGKPSEIEYQNGTVVKLGVKYGVETPVNRMVYHCILPMEMKARGKL